MADSNVPHSTEDRLRNIEAHLGIGNVDEETGEYTVNQAGEGGGKGASDEETETETGV